MSQLYCYTNNNTTSQILYSVHGIIYHTPATSPVKTDLVMSQLYCSTTTTNTTNQILYSVYGVYHTPATSPVKTDLVMSQLYCSTTTTTTTNQILYSVYGVYHATSNMANQIWANRSSVELSELSRQQKYKQPSRPCVVPVGLSHHQSAWSAGQILC